MKAYLDKAGLGWVTFQVMRRTHATLMKGLGIDGKLVADQLGHGLDVNQNVYTHSPVAMRLPAVNRLEKSLNGADNFEYFRKLLILWSGRPGSNRRHSAWEADVLPLNYSRL
jgi:hypothetical protein